MQVSELRSEAELREAFPVMRDLRTHLDEATGGALLAHVEDLGRREACETVALNSGEQRHDAHRFYETRMGYVRTAYTFAKRVAAA